MNFSYPLYFYFSVFCSLSNTPDYFYNWVVGEKLFLHKLFCLSLFIVSMAGRQLRKFCFTDCQSHEFSWEKRTALR